MMVLPAPSGDSSEPCEPGCVPMGEVHDNIHSLAMVEAAIESNAVAPGSCCATICPARSSARSPKNNERTSGWC